MRLLNTKTLRFKEFLGSENVIYAILSHRWGRTEADFQELMSANDLEGPRYEKILSCCSFANQRGYAWVWIDTCCIDKKSSAELSEAINSMYHWYQNAAECYAYLSDVPVVSEAGGLSQQLESVAASEWFKRGWTLQELLAPARLVFLDRSWNIIADKNRIASEISRVTGIPELYLKSPEQFREASVAMKMSWASGRRTERTEDRAYSLLGIFGIAMPLLYGEGGRRAFLRLQLEILKISDDESIFAWKTEHRPREDPGLLALWPEEFASSGNVVQHRFAKDRPPYSMTHKGLKLHVPAHLLEGTNQVRMPLNCRNSEATTPLVIFLYQSASSYWARLHSEELITAPVDHIWTRQDCSFPNKVTIYVRQTAP